MAFATTDRMDGVAAGYNRPNLRGTASRGAAAEGFDRVLSAAGAREPRAAEARRVGADRAADVQARTPAQKDDAAAPARRDATQAQGQAEAGRDADLDPKRDTSAKARAADTRGGATREIRGDEPDDAPDDVAEVSAPEADAEAVTDAPEPRKAAAETPAPVVAVTGAASADPNVQAAAQPAPVPQDAGGTQAAQAISMAQSAQVAAGQIRTDVAAAVGTGASAPEKTEGETEEPPADPVAPAGLPAFLALLAAAPAPLQLPTPGAPGAGAGAIQAGGSGTASAGAPVPGQGPEAAFPQVPGGAAAGASESLAATVAGVQGAKASTVKETGTANETGNAKETGRAGSGAGESAAKPDLLAALAVPVAEAGSAAAGQTAGQAGAQAAAAGLGQAGAAHGAAHAAGSAAAPAATPATPPVQISQVPMTIGLRALSGSSQFEIRLDPLELGRIDVKLEIDKERGTVMTHMVVERVETLAMLQRDANSLQQALSQAGLDAQEGGINLSLRGDGQSGDRAGDQGAGQDGRAPRGPWVPEAERVAEAPLRMLRGLGGLDIRI